MANDTQSSRGSKDDENNSSIKKPVSIKESSAGEMLLQKQMSSNPSARSRSEHLDRPMPTTSSIKGKSEIVEKQRMPSPSRRSDRGKEHVSLVCSGSVKSGSPDYRRKKLKSEETVKQLMRDSMETSRRVKHLQTVGFKKKMDGHTYKSLLLKRRRETDPDSCMMHSPF